jgi:hypothetical protein
MSPKLVVMVAGIVPSAVASVSGASTSRAGSRPSSGYSQVVVSPAGSESLDVSLEGSVAVSDPSV